MSNINWLGYLIVIIITIFISSLITEKITINRLMLSEGVEIAYGKCRLKRGYGKLQTNMTNIINDQ